MDNFGFLVTAYVVGFLAVGGYAWLLHRRLRRAQREAGSQTARSRGST